MPTSIYTWITFLGFSAQTLFVTSSVIPNPIGSLQIEARSDSTLTSPYNDCMDPQNTEKDLRITTCTPKKTLDANGNCGPLDPQGGSGSYSGSAAFCQVDVRWNYGREVEFPGSCQCADAHCAITNSESVAVQNAFDFSIGGNLKSRDLQGRDANFGSLKAADLLNVFNAGATWSYSTTYTNTTATQNVKPSIAANKCGYWTFVPYYVTTCGTLTYTTETYGVDAATTSDPTTINGWCQTAPYTDSHGTPMGETVFVARICGKSELLSFCWQDPAYLDQGVSKNASLFTEYQAAHEDFDMTKPLESTSVIWCETDTHGYTEGEPLSGCGVGLPAGVKMTPAYTLPS